MQPEPTTSPYNLQESQILNFEYQSEEEPEDVFNQLSIASPARKHDSKRVASKLSKGKAVTTPRPSWRSKGKDRDGQSGKCYLLNLPEDVIHIILARLPPKTLLAISKTCKYLHGLTEDDAIWKHSYINHYFSESVSRNSRRIKDVDVLAQSCCNMAERGWKKEALGREIIARLWTTSKANLVLHTPPTGLIHSISLCYPPSIPIMPKNLVIGKNRHLIPSQASPIYAEKLGQSCSLSPRGKTTYRQKYEATIAAKTRPPPYMLSASLFMGGVVRSDPISGKVSKGFWGPGRDANFHLRPYMDPLAEPSAIHLPTRSQAFILWGLRTGGVIYTSVQTRHHATHGGRASSLNIYCDLRQAHEAQVNDIWIPQGQDSPSLKWITAGEDGRVKLWQLHPCTSTSKSNKKSHIVDGSIECIFTSTVVESCLSDRSEEMKRRQSVRPDGIILARYDHLNDVVAGVTEDGDLRVWFRASSETNLELRIDLGSAESHGEVKFMEMATQLALDESTVSIVIHRHHSHLITRHDISISGKENVVTFQALVGASFSCIHTSLQPSLPISSRKTGQSTPMLIRMTGSSETTRSTLPKVPNLNLSDDSPDLKQTDTEFGKFIMAGDEAGYVHIWAWNEEESERKPLRSWQASEGKITALDASCGLVAIGSYDGWIKVYDPVPNSPSLLRSFHALHLSAGEVNVAASSQPDARHYTVNQIVLENDLVVAAIGRRVFAWQASNSKSKNKHSSKYSNSWKKGNQKGEGKNSRGIDMKDIHLDVEEDLNDPIDCSHRLQLSASHEFSEREALHKIGLEDGEDALQYALLLSMEEQKPSNSQAGGLLHQTKHSNHVHDKADRGMDEETQEAIRQVEAFKKAEVEEETKRMLDMIEQVEKEASSQ
ncbi:uncharacterized protein L203_101315 [Cryptococcus depauperatus CBS 7841]|uniref:F-box domain-containing protein n=1 Tax=Cryptococcus depauperatus CBS 7841 TaxID=1295531 RepID=A0AAJ8JPQ3_9TREE